MRTDGSNPIYVRVTMLGKRLELSTGINAMSDAWNGGNQLLNGKSPEIKIKNNRLEKTYSNIPTVHKNYH